MEISPRVSVMTKCIGGQPARQLVRFLLRRPSGATEITGALGGAAWGELRAARCAGRAWAVCPNSERVDRETLSSL